MTLRLGKMVATPAVLKSVPHSEILSALQRHMRGDWGDVCAEDKSLNDAAARDGSRVLSAYTSNAGTKFWIITEWDRSATTVLLPEEY